MRRVYFDYNATTPIHPEVAEAASGFWREFFGNPSSIHWAGREVKDLYEESREQVALVLNASTDEIVFTSGGTEGDNQAVKGVAFSRRDRGRHIITSAVEHPGVLNACRYLEGMGFEVTYLPVDSQGLLTPEDVDRAIRSDTILVSLMYANNETGTLLPIAEIGALARHRGVVMHSDMVQALGKIELDPAALNVDLASFSGHKVYAPKGTGILYVREGLEIDSLIHGGHQEGGRRAGTENVMGAVALGKACEVARRDLAGEKGRIAALRARLLDGIMASIDDVTMNGHPTRCLPNTLNLSFRYVESEALLTALDFHGIAVSSGSACSSGSGEPSHVLLAMGIQPAVCQTATRFSLGRGTREDDVEYALSVLPNLVRRLREMSPLSGT
jgi:cysteine desulfurase